MGDLYESITDEVLNRITDVEIRHGIGELFAAAQRDVDDGRVDVVFIAARRLSCLYRLLVRAGMPSIQDCLVVSNRLLDAPPSFDWRQTRILVLDDSVLVGTTLFRMNDDLLALGARDIRFRSVCVDVEQQVDYLVQDLDFLPALKRDTKAVELLSSQIVQILFTSQIPYFTDYPVTVPLKFSRDSWFKRLSTSRWLSADVTAPLLEDGVHSALTLIPTDHTYSHIVRKLIPAVGRLVEAVKIRLFVQNDSSEVQVVAVPIALVGACEVGDVDQALSELSHALGIDADSHGIIAGWKPQAKHRLLQLYVSTCVLSDFWADFSISSNQDGPVNFLATDALDLAHVQLYFGPYTSSALEAFDAVVALFQNTPEIVEIYPSATNEPTPSWILNKPEVRDLLWDTREMLASVGTPPEPLDGNITKLGLIFAHGLCALFGFIDRDIERPERADIAALKDSTSYRELYEKSERRLLRQGLTLRDLTRALCPENLAGSRWQRAVTSLGIDVGNDLGITVPVTRYDNIRDIVFRGYRLGETAFLANRPLPEVAQASDAVLDEMSASVSNGYPINSIVNPIGSADANHDAGRIDSTAALIGLVGKIIPGVAVEKYIGTVTSVGDERFDAEILGATRGDRRYASMSLDQVRDDDREEITPGTRFLWTVRQQQVGGAQDRTSRVRVLRRNPINVPRFEERLATLEAMSNADQ